MASRRLDAFGVAGGGRRRWIRGAAVAVAVAAGIVALGAAGAAGVSASARSRPSRWDVAAATSGVPGTDASRWQVPPAAAGTVPDPAPESRARRLREFRRMIVALYRIPGDGSAEAFGGDPIHEMWHGLAEQFGSRAAAQRLDQEWYLVQIAPALSSPTVFSGAGGAGPAWSPNH